MKVDVDRRGGLVGYNFTGITSPVGQEPLHSLMQVLIEPNSVAKAVWFDSYGGIAVKEGQRMTTWGWLNPDDAEMIGLALIHAAKLARGEKL